MSVLHLNARSLYGNFEKFNQLLGSLDHSFSVIGVTETWLNESTSDLVNIPDYNFVSVHRTHKSCGGVGLYLRNQFEFKVRQDLNSSSPNCFEVVFTEIIVPRGKNIIIGTIYRPPDQNVNEFLESMRNLLTIVSKKNKNRLLHRKCAVRIFIHESQNFRNERVSVANE